MIEVKDLTKYYGSQAAIKNVSFTIKKGEVVGFLGPNGAGKTTTMKILTGFMPATTGSVTIAGYDVEDHSLEVRRRIGYLPENAPLYTDLNVWEYVTFIADLQDIPRSRRTKRMREIIDVCGLKDKLRSEIGELSKGYRQRVGLAGALLHDPEVLILDEPTSGLDPNQIIEIRGLIKKIGTKKTVFLSTHILSEVESTCNRALIINRGQIVAQGTTDELRDFASGANRVYVQIEGSYAHLVDVVKRIPGVIDFTETEMPGIHDNVTGVFIETEKGKDLRKEIGYELYKAGLPLLELKREEISLENVFAQLTS